MEGQTMQWQKKNKDKRANNYRKHITQKTTD